MHSGRHAVQIPHVSHCSTNSEDFHPSIPCPSIEIKKTDSLKKSRSLEINLTFCSAPNAAVVHGKKYRKKKGKLKESVQFMTTKRKRG
jgi:hypothetical protein